MRLTRIPPLWTSTTDTTSEFDMKAVSFRTVLSNQYLYAAPHLHPGRPKGRFKRSPLSPGSNDILLLPPSDPNSWTRTGFGPPARGSAPSTSSGVDLQASGLVLVTNHRLKWQTWDLATLRLFGFPSSAHLTCLPSPRAQTPSLVLQDVRGNTDRTPSLALQASSFLSCRLSPSPNCFRRF